MGKPFTEYARQLYKEQGKEALFSSYERTKEEGLHDLSISSFERLCRRIHREAVGVQLDTERSQEQIATLEEAMEFHQVPESLRNQIKSVKYSTWDSGNQTNRAVSFQLKNDETLSPEDIAKIFLELTKDYNPPRIQAHPTLNDELLGMIILGDPHIGRSVYGPRIGREQGFGIEEQKQEYLASIAALLETKEVDRYCMPLLGDTLNSDMGGADGQSRATAKGTPQPENVDPRLMFKAGLDILKSAILMVAEKKNVDVVAIPGNHDETSAYTLYTALQQFFIHDSRVNFVLAESPYQPYKWGKHGSMFAHGHLSKVNELGWIFVHDFKELYSHTDFQSIFIGHFHHKKRIPIVDEKYGMRLHYAPSVADDDSWHHGKGYRGIRQATLHLISKDRGEIAEYYHTL